MKFRLLPEWAEQDAVMLTWPHQDTDWAANLTAVEPVYVALCQARDANKMYCIQAALLVPSAADQANAQHAMPRHME